jgi:hypothetical protein
VSLISGFYVGALEVVMGEKVSPYLRLSDDRYVPIRHPPGRGGAGWGVRREAEQEEQEHRRGTLKGTPCLVKAGLILIKRRDLKYR